MNARIFGRISRFGRDERGLSIVEFAMIAPFLGFLIVGIADLGRGYAQRFALQQAANRTLELAHSGTRRNDYSFLEAEAEAAAGTGADATVTQWLECNGGAAQAFTAMCPSAQQTARYVTLEIVKNFDPVFTSAGYPGATSTGMVPLKARASLRVQ